MPSEHQARDARVDFLRGVAITSVLLLDFSLVYGVRNSPLAALGSGFAKAVLYNGNYGVTLFFVVSGYLITSMSLTRWGSLGQVRPRQFYTYRVARIAPPLLPVLAFIVVPGSFGVAYFSNSDGGHALPASYFIVAVVAVLTFWHNVLMQSQAWFNYCLNIYWSLSVEEVFYLAMPLCCIGLRRKRLFALACHALIVLGPLYRSQHSDDELFFECGYAACFDAIALGCLTALAVRRWAVSGRTARALRIAAGCAFAGVYLRGIDGHEVLGFTQVALCAALYLFAAANDRDPSLATGRLTTPLRWLGRHSYELYLFHIVILALMRNLASSPQLPAWAWTPWLALFLTTSAFVAHTVAARVSEPANAAIRRWARWGSPETALP